MVEKDMDDLHSQALSIQNSYQDKALKLQALRVHEEELMKSLVDVRMKILKSTSELETVEQQAKDKCEAIKLVSP